MKYLKKLLTPRHTKDPLPHSIKHNRVYILPTKSGILFCGMLFIMFLVSLNNNNNLGLLLTFLLASMFITSMIYTHSNLLGLKILSLTTKPTYSGDTLEILCSVFSPKITRPLISINLSEQVKSIAEISEDKNQLVILKAENLKRGKYRPKFIQIETEFPFSFFRAWTYVKTDLECVIYPQPIANNYQGETISGSSENDESGQSIKGNDDFDGLKNYQSGDPLKQIYWKGFSRGGGLHSMTYSGGKSDTILLDFDSIKAEDVEKRLSFLSFKINELNHKKIKFGLKLPNTFIDPENSEAHKNNCLETLALFGEKYD